MVAETARLRCDLTEVTMPDELVVGLTQLTSYRTDLMGDGAFDFPYPLILVADLGTPAELRTAGIDGVTMHLRKRCLPCRY
jgi:hypothetical protein